MNFSLESSSRALVEGEDAPHRLLRNEYFAWLQRQGYTVEVVAAGYLGLCEKAAVPTRRCKNYQFGALRSLHRLDVPWGSKVSVLLGHYVTRYHRYRRALEAYESLVQPRLVQWGMPAPTLPQDSLWTWRHLLPLSVSAMAAMDEITKDILLLPPGRALFVHLLFPHSPFVFQADCSPRLIQDSTGLALDGPDRYWGPTQRARLYDGYLEQAECLYRLLDSTFQQMLTADLLSQSIVILHGDHGSRLGLHAPLPGNVEHMADRDYRDAFGTLFAVKLPGQSGGYDPSPRSLQHLFGEALASGIKVSPPQLPDEGEPFVFALVGEGKPFQRKPYPR